MRNAMNIYKRKDGRFEGRIPSGYDENGKIKYRYLYSKNLSELKEKMLISYADLSNSSQNKCGKTFKALCEEWLMCILLWRPRGDVLIGLILWRKAVSRHSKNCEPLLKRI